jgi:hypothetical protein
LAPTPSCCNGAKRLWLLGPGVRRLLEPRPTLADELKEWWNKVKLSKKESVLEARIV